MLSLKMIKISNSWFRKHHRMSAEQEINLERQFLHSGYLKIQLPKRFIVTILGFIGMFNVYAMRMNMSVAIVAMVNASSYIPVNNTMLRAECPAEDIAEDDISDSGNKAERYNWDSVTQSQIIGSFFYTYFITVLIGGYLAERFGAHRIFGVGIFMTSLLTLLVPVTVQWGFVPLLVIRAMQGLFEGVTFPAMASVVSRWAPKMERSRMHSVIFSGTIIGNVVTFSVSGWLCSTEFLGGWPSVFYIFGMIGCVWYFFWYLFVYESPFKHPFITADELILYKDNMKISKKHLRVPWFKIFSSLPVWAMLIAYMGAFFADTITYTELPTYLSSVLHVDVKYTGFYSALPNISICAGSWVSSYVADTLRKKGFLDITKIRKIFNSLSGYMLALSLLSIPFCGCRTWLVLTIYSFGMFMNGCKYSGYQVSSVDMSPTYSGIIYGFANGVSAIFGIAAPAMVGALTTSGATIANWSKVFYVAAVFSAVTTTFFALFSSAELQPWEKPDCEKESNGAEDFEQMQISKLRMDQPIC